MIKCRHYTQDDFGMLSDWWQAHGNERALIRGMLPPCGVIAERDGIPVAACFMHLSASVGVAFLESPVSLPDLTLRETFEAFDAVLSALEEIAKVHDYNVLVVNTLPGIARFLERRGFSRCGERIQLMKTWE